MANLRNGIVIVARSACTIWGEREGRETRNKVTRDVVAEPGRGSYFIGSIPTTAAAQRGGRKEGRWEGRDEGKTVEGTATNTGQLS